MIDNYNLNINSAVHTIRVTFMVDNFVGHVAYKLRGNCKGLDVLEPMFDSHEQSDIDNYVENDCEFTYCEYAYCYTLVLTNGEGERCLIEADDDELRNMIVALEIVNVERDDNESD